MRPREFFLLSAALALTGCLLVPHFQDSETTEDQRLARLSEEVQEDVEMFRGVRFTKPPKVQRILAQSNCEELDVASKSGWTASTVVDPSALNDRIWRAAGLLRVADTVSSQRRKLDCFASRSLYQVNSKRILVFMDSLRQDERRVLTHEMVHAQQDQRLDLRSFLRSSDEPDEKIGILAAVEGEAEFVSGRLTDPRKASDGCGGSVSSAMWELDKAFQGIPHLANAPPSISFPAYVPYVFGERLACRMFERYGKAGLDSMMARPPKGSWQLWHLDDYFENRSPIDWDTAWSTLPKLPKGWIPLGQARTGEARLAALPLTWDRKLARKVLRGRGLSWRGDRIWVAGMDTTRTALLWRLAFTDGSKAMDFAKTWWTLREIRLGRKIPPWKKSAKSMFWRDSLRVAYTVRVEGSEVGIAEGFDSLTTVRMLLRTMARPRRAL